MKKICLTSTILFIALLSLGIFGCGQDTLVQPPAEMDAEEMVFASPSAPVTVVSLKHYRSWRRTPEYAIVDNRMPIGKTVYTEVVFSKDMPLKARPVFKATVDGVRERFTLVPPGIRGKDFVSGSVKPVQGTRIYVCKYTLPKRVGATFSISVRVPAGVVHSEVLEVTASLSLNEEDAHFTGRVYDSITSRDRGSPVRNVVVTILSGPRRNEYTKTDEEGFFTFPHVSGDALRVRVEKEGFEPKVVTVHRSGPTKMADGRVPNYPRYPNLPEEEAVTQKNPGTIVIGHVWPEEARKILAKTEVVIDLLLRSDPKYGGYGGYGKGVIRINPERLPDSDHYTWVLAHEIMHAHQHGVTRPDGRTDYMTGTGSPGEYENSDEGRAFVQAWKKDLAEFGKTPLDKHPYTDDNTEENAAEIFAYWWSLGTWWEAPEAHKEWGKEWGNLQVTAPNRMKWARKWFPKS